MRRRTPQDKARNVPGQSFDAQARTMQTAKVPVVAPQQEPIPPSLARWTGNLLYWVTSLGAQYYAQVIAPLGLTPPQVAVLQVLAGEGVLRQARLAERTRIDKATMVALLNDLEQRGLLERQAAPNDKRAFDIYLTETGRAIMRQVEDVSEAAEDQFYGVLSAQERQTLRTLLLRLMVRLPEALEE